MPLSFSNHMKEVIRKHFPFLYELGYLVQIKIFWYKYSCTYLFDRDSNVTQLHKNNWLSLCYHLAQFAWLSAAAKCFHEYVYGLFHVYLFFFPGLALQVIWRHIWGCIQVKSRSTAECAQLSLLSLYI